MIFIFAALSILIGPASQGSLSSASQQPVSVVRTGDPAKRGLTAADFPRVRRLATDVYSYEQLRSAGAETFTTVSLFVVSPNRVLVADGQGSVAETRRMIDEIAKITPQPITHVVVCSDHGDHTAGNSAFPSAATFYAHPTSMSVLGAAGAAMTSVTEKTTLRLGNIEVQLLFLGRAHTGGECNVYLPASKILFMSEAFLNRIFPAMRSHIPLNGLLRSRRPRRWTSRRLSPDTASSIRRPSCGEELETFRQALRQVIPKAAGCTRLASQSRPPSARRSSAIPRPGR